MKKQAVVIASAAIALLVGIGFYIAAASIYPSIGYGLEAEFTTLPANDDALTEWLKSQPGVVPHTVHVQRRGDHPQRVEVIFIMSRNLLGRPFIPNLERGCQKLGYDGRQTPFRDSPR